MSRAGGASTGGSGRGGRCCPARSRSRRRTGLASRRRCSTCRSSPPTPPPAPPTGSGPPGPPRTHPQRRAGNRRGRTRRTTPPTLHPPGDRSRTWAPAGWRVSRGTYTGVAGRVQRGAGFDGMALRITGFGRDVWWATRVDCSPVSSPPVSGVTRAGNDSGAPTPTASRPSAGGTPWTTGASSRPRRARTGRAGIAPPTVRVAVGGSDRPAHHQARQPAGSRAGGPDHLEPDLLEHGPGADERHRQVDPAGGGVHRVALDGRRLAGRRIPDRAVDQGRGVAAAAVAPRGRRRI